MSLDFDAYLRIPRLSGLHCSPSGRLVVQMATASPDATRFVTALWDVHPETGAVTRLTAPREGATLAGFLPDDSVLFTAKREDPEAGPDEKKPGEVASLWLSPGAGGEPRRVAATPAGVGSVAVARAAGTVAMLSDVFPTAQSLADDAVRAEAREKAGTKALWFDGYPIRYWDHHLAPRAPRLFLLTIPAEGLADPTDLTGDVGQALRGASLALTPDGTRVVTTWEVAEGRGVVRRDVVVIDVATRERRTLLGESHVSHEAVALSPDGRQVAVVVQRLPRVDTPPRVELWLTPLAGDAPARRLAGELDRWPQGVSFSPDSSAVVFTADHGGRAAAYAVPLTPPDAPARRLSTDGAFSDLGCAGASVYALRSSCTVPPEVVRLPLAGENQQPLVLHSPTLAEPLPGRIEEVTADAEDGTRLRAWLVLPPEASATTPAPLVLFIHGGPLSSWNAWSWRWQPQLLAARGYAVLLPDPALSTGYGQAMIQRGWGQWGGAPYTDVLALTDAALQRPDLDSTRTAVTGGSYGGYLTNWVIGHTDRFRCAVTHASLWSLRAFHGTTDNAVYWEDEFGDPDTNVDFYERWSPSASIARIRTPTLVVHGEQDYRVAVSEGLSLYTSLQRHGVESALLYLPDENHWVLKPGNARVWYEAFLGWLDQHLRDGGPARPGLL